MPPRLKRYQHEGHLHFLTFSCYRCLSYLDDDHARICFEDTVELCRRRHHFDIHGYVLMPEHVHLLVNGPEKCTSVERHRRTAPRTRGYTTIGLIMLTALRDDEPGVGVG